MLVELKQTEQPPDLRGRRMVILNPISFEQIALPETHEVVVERYTDAPAVWAGLMRGHPKIERVYFSHYPEHFPGYGYTTPLQGVTSSYSVEEIIGTLENGFWPKSEHGEICAISPTVEARSASGKLDLFTFPAVDIDRQHTEALADAIDSLRLVHVDWSLLNTGGGLHVIEHELVSIQTLPQYLAGMIRMFVRTPGTEEGRLANIFADTLHTNPYNPGVIRWVCKGILDRQLECRYVDLNNCALMLLEAVDALINPGPAGFFRISNKPSRGRKPPYLVAEQVNGVVYKYVGVNP